MLASQTQMRSGKCCKAFSGRQAAPSARRQRQHVVTSASTEVPSSSRRDILGLVGVGMAVVATGAMPSAARADIADRYNITVVKVNNLSNFQRADQRKEYRRRAEDILAKFLTAEDAPAALRLVLHDAGTYDYASKTGGFDGSIVLPEELSRPENKDLAPLVEKLAAAKQEVDTAAEAAKQAAISWADLLYLAGKVATQKAWVAAKSGRASTQANKDLITKNFAAEWPATLGRLDSGVSGPAGKIPSADAPVEDIRAYLLTLGAKPDEKPSPFTAKPPFWERPGFVIWTAAAADPAAEEARFAAADQTFADLKKKYDNSRKTLTRTDYEVDFTNYYNKLTSVGAKFNEDAYLRDELVYTPKKL